MKEKNSSPFQKGTIFQNDSLREPFWLHFFSQCTHEPTKYPSVPIMALYPWNFPLVFPMEFHSILMFLWYLHIQWIGFDFWTGLLSSLFVGYISSYEESATIKGLILWCVITWIKNGHAISYRTHTFSWSNLCLTLAFDVYFPPYVFSLCLIAPNKGSTLLYTSVIQHKDKSIYPLLWCLSNICIVGSGIDWQGPFFNRVANQRIWVVLPTKVPI